jgi:hypothetical protein
MSCCCRFEFLTPGGGGEARLLGKTTTQALTDEEEDEWYTIPAELLSSAPADDEGVEHNESVQKKRDMKISGQRRKIRRVDTVIYPHICFLTYFELEFEGDTPAGRLNALFYWTLLMLHEIMYAFHKYVDLHHDPNLPSPPETSGTTTPSKNAKSKLLPSPSLRN